MLVQPYLMFDGRCEEAIAFYKGAVDAELIMQLRFSEIPDQPPPERLPSGSENKICHASLRIGDSVVLASDGDCQGKPNFQGFQLSLTVTSPAEAEKYFANLASGGKVKMPLMKTFFSPNFGMVEDRFGISWIVLVRGEKTA